MKNILNKLDKSLDVLKHLHETRDEVIFPNEETWKRLQNITNYHIELAEFGTDHLEDLIIIINESADKLIDMEEKISALELQISSLEG